MKKKRSVPPPAKTGVARQYLQEHYADVPSREPCVGHLLYVYLENEKSSPKTIRVLQGILGESWSVLSNDLSLINKKFTKFQNLGRTKEMERYVDFCSAPFRKNNTLSLPTVADSVDLTEFSQDKEPVSEHHNESSEIGIPGPSDILGDNNPEPGSSQMSGCLDPHPLNSSPSVSVISESNSGAATPTPYKRGIGLLTPTKTKMKKRIDFVSKMRTSEKKKYQKQIRNLKDKVDVVRVSQIRYLNQDVIRKRNSMKVKDATIRLLKKQLCDAKLGTSKCQPKTMESPAFSQLKRNHNRLKKLNQKKRQKAKNKAAVSLEEYTKLKNELSVKDEIIRNLENRILELEESLAELQAAQNIPKATKKDGKTYSVETRMLVYNALVNQVPTKNIPALIEDHAQSTGQKLMKIPQRTAVEQMARELDVIADLKAAELAMKTPNLTVGFDATTQEGTHINSVHLTSKNECEVIDVEELPGGTAVDYHDHVTSCVDNLADTYSEFHGEEYQHSRSTIIRNISNSMTDRVTVNHATIEKINQTWGKSLNELNCHLHPLDTISTSCKSALKNLEISTGHLYGKDCFAGNLVLQINKFRYKDGKGDPKGFKTFLHNEHLPKGLIPRYRGNRLHVLFHICGKLIEHHSKFLKFFTQGTVSCGGLQSSIRKDFENPTAILEMQALGLIGKLVSGPWMQTFYSSANSEISHVQGIRVVKEVVSRLKQAVDDPLSLLTQDSDFFGRPLNLSDQTLVKLRQQQLDGCKENLKEILKACLEAVVVVLERQYKRYFDMSITTSLEEETATARLHNIDAEEIMGMFGAAKQRSKNASMDFLRAKMRAKKNRVVPYLKGLYQDQQERIVTWAVRRAGKKRIANRKKKEEIQKELSLRAAVKYQQKVERERKNVEKRLKILKNPRDVKSVFPELDDITRQDLECLLDGKAVGKQIMHTWYDSDNKAKTQYSGKIEKEKKVNGAICYIVAYWLPDEETYDEDSEDTPMTKYELGADLINGDLMFC